MEHVTNTIANAIKASTPAREEQEKDLPLPKSILDKIKLRNRLLDKNHKNPNVMIKNRVNQLQREI